MSTRMGVDKSLLPVCGVPMIQLVADKVRLMGDEIIITSNDPAKYTHINARIVPDEYKNFGALAGLHAGLKAAINDLVIVVATDMPFINLELFAFMKERMEPEVDVVIPLSNEGFEPFHAIYRKSTCLPAIENAILHKKKRIISWFEMVKVVTIDTETILKIDQDELAFYNINTPEDRLLAEKILLEKTPSKLNKFD